MQKSKRGDACLKQLRINVYRQGEALASIALIHGDNVAIRNSKLQNMRMDTKPVAKQEEGPTEVFRRIPEAW